jgi:hypothetical protein
MPTEPVPFRDAPAFVVPSKEGTLSIGEQLLRSRVVYVHPAARRPSDQSRKNSLMSFAHR